MNLKNILWVRNTGDIVPNAPIGDNLFGMKLSGGGIITTATGNPVSIVTNKAQNAISTILSYSPKQSGQGDPSPQNIRPIEGWAEANLGVNSETPTLTESLGGTYYGFSIDVERGVLRFDTEYVTLDGIDENWMIQGQENRKFFRLNLSTEGYRNGIAICDQYPCISIRTDNKDIGFNLAFSTNYFHFRFRPENVSEMDIDDWKAMLANQPVHVVIYRSEPIEIPLTPQTVALLAGANTLWTDGNSVTITYRR